MFSRSVASDEHLIQRFKAGDLDAFNLLYERHAPRVINRVRFVVPESDIEDVTQEVFVAALKSLDSFRGDALFSTWLRTLTNYKVAEYYRRRNRKQDPQETSLTEAEILPDEGDGVALEERIAMRNALLSLPEKYREIILMRVSEEMRFEEIAKTLGINLEAAKSLFRRAVASLRKTLEEST